MKVVQAGEGRQPLERVTVNLTLRSSKALQLAADLTGDTKTDIINRALQAYAYLEHIISTGGAIYSRESENGELMQIVLLIGDGPNGTATAIRQKSRRPPGRA